MVSATSKRKPESVLPGGPGKLRRTNATAKKDVVDATEPEEESSDGLFVHEKTAPVKKGNPKTRKSNTIGMARNDEYEEDVGRTETQQFLALVEFQSKKKRNAAKELSQYLEDFKNEMEEDNNALQRNLYSLSIAISKKDNVFLKAFEASFRSAAPFESATRQTDSSEHRGFAFIHKKSKKLTNDAADLVSKFERVTQRFSELDTMGLDGSRWQEEDETTTNLLAIGESVGISKYKNILMASRELPMDPEMTRIAEILYHTEDNQALGNWGKMARKQEKAARRIVKALTMDAI